MGPRWRLLLNSLRLAFEWAIDVDDPHALRLAVCRTTWAAPGLTRTGSHCSACVPRDLLWMSGRLPHVPHNRLAWELVPTGG